MKKIFLILMLSVSLFAGHSGEIYTYGYFQYIQETLMALSGVVANGNDYLFKIVIALSMLIFIIKNIGNPKGASMLGFEFAKFLTVVTIIQQLFLTAPDDDKHAYAIVDRITSQTAEVRQIPKGIGEMLSLFSRLEDAVMDKMDMFFSTPNSTSYRNAGLGFTMTSQMEIFQSTITDPHLKRSFDVYYENCKLLGDYADGVIDMNEVLNSNDLMTMLGTDQSLLTIVYDSANPSGVTTPCFTAWDNIKSRIINSTTNQMDAVAKARGLTAIAYGQKAEEAYQTLYGSFLSAQNQFEEAILRNATLESVQGVAANLGIGAERLAKNKSIAEMSMVTEAGMSNLEAQGIVPLMKAISMMFVIALSWLLAILAIATMNMSYLKFLITLNVWLMLWSPLYTVLNFAMDVMVDNSMAAFNAGVAINSQMSIYQVLGAKLAVLAKLVWAIPMLAFAVAKGSDQAMTSFIGGMAQGIQTGIAAANTQELRQTATGNFSYISGNEQFGGKVNEHGQHVISRTEKGAHGQVEASVATTSSGATANAASPSGKISITGNESSTGGYTLGAVGVSGEGIGANKVQSAQNAETKAKQEVHNVMESSGIASSNVVSKMVSAAENKESTEGKAYNEKVVNGDQENIQKITSKAQEDASSALAGETFTVTTKEGKVERLIVGASGQIGTPEWLGSSAKLSINKQGDVSYTDDKGQTQSLQTSNSFKQSWNEQMSKSVQNTIANNNELAKSWMVGVKNTLSEQSANVDATQEQYSTAYSKSEAASKTYTDMKSLNEQISQDKLPSMMMNYFKQDENLRALYFNENGDVKDTASLKALAMEGQKLLGTWTQGGEEGLRHFAAFANQYGGINTGGNGIKANVDNATNDGTAARVSEEVNNARNTIVGVGKADVMENIKDVGTKNNNIGGEIDNRSNDLKAPSNGAAINGARDILNSHDGVNAVSNMREINNGITSNASSLKGADPVAGKLEEAYEWAEKQGIAPAGGSGQTPGSSQFNKEPNVNENLSPISSLIKNFGKDL